MQTTHSFSSETHAQVYLSRPWAKKYPPSMPKEIDLGNYKNIFQMLEESGRKHGKLPAFTNMGVSYSFDETLDKAEAFASYLQNVLKLEKGDRVAIQSPNLLQYPVALFGILKAGMTVVNTNPLYTTREMAHQFKDSGAKAILILENFADKLEEILPETQIKHVIITEIGDGLPLAKRLLTNFVVRVVKKMVPAHGLRGTRFNEALALGRAAPSRPVQIGLDDVAFLQYTGGTTGVSKAAMLTHRNILSNLTQMSEWFKPKLKEGVESVITALPLYHVFSLTVNCFGLYKIGTNNILVTNPKDIPAFVKLLATSKPTIITAVSTLLGALMQDKGFDSVDFSSVKVTVAGGMALKASVANEWKKRTGTTVLEGYGLTETSPLATCNPLDGQDQLGTIGIPVPSTDMMLIDDDGKPVPQGEAGEICVKGPQVMKGYYNRPEETEKVMLGEWLKTGDMGVMEKDGFFRITDRKKDMILVSGFNVYPNEIEDVIMMHPKVLEAAAIGIPDEHSGEIVKLFVVPRDPSLTIEEVSTFCREKLVAYKCPRKIEFRKEIPKTNIGKPLRRMLRDQ
ncbi:MAG: AMP-binding protein [Bdellovibrionales bacterium]|nr:AMP-binding protein [Bdellovibrionales bacterium]